MRNAKPQQEDFLSDPAPCVCSNEEIKKAQALREALRRKLLDRTEPASDPYWTIGAD